MHTKYGETA